VTAVAVHGDDLYLVTHHDAPRSQVVRVPLAAPDLTAATVMLPDGERAVAGIRVVGDHLLVHERDGGISRVRRVPLDGGAPQEVPLPANGAIQRWTTHPGRPEAFITLNSWTQSRGMYRYGGNR
jgi:prolyl oligopeptidase